MNWNRLIRTAFVAVLLLMSIHLRLEKSVEAKQAEIAKQLIRFHVRANSDSKADQELKLKVRDSVIGYLEGLLQQASSVEESEQIVVTHMEDILACAMNTIHQNGYEYDLRGYLVEENFPLRNYGDIALPPGKYKAFRIDIGQGQGKNWWCVLYPPLCFVDITHGEFSNETKEVLKKEELKQVIGEEDYQFVDTCELEFKYLKFMNQWMK